MIGTPLGSPTSPKWEVFQGRETELNWEQRDRELGSLIQALPNYNEALLAAIKAHFYEIFAVLGTPRTQLSLQACKFVQQLAKSLSKADFEPFADHAIATLSRLCGSTKRLVATAAGDALFTVFLSSPTAKVLAAARMALADKNSQYRARLMEGLRHTILTTGWEKKLAKNWAELEAILTKAICDAVPAVRIAASEIITHLTAFDEQLLSQFVQKLDTSTRKQLALLQSRQRTPAPIGIVPGSDQIAGDVTTSSDDEVIIPMQNITISPNPPKEGITIGPDTPDRVANSPCRLPIRARPADRQLAMSTPFRRYTYAHVPASPATGKTALPLLEELLANVDLAPVQAATWKKVLFLVDSGAAITKSQIFGLLNKISQILPSTPIEDYGVVGLLVKSMLEKLGDSAEMEDFLIDSLCTLSQQNSLFAHVWGSRPFAWIQHHEKDLHVRLVQLCLASVSDEKKIVLLNAVQSILISKSQDKSAFSEVLPILKPIWHSSKSYMPLRKEVVATLGLIRRSIGDFMFFQSLPNLSISDRRLLDAYMTLDL